jgi:hypothetical protein
MALDWQDPPGVAAAAQNRYEPPWGPAGSITYDAQGRRVIRLVDPPEFGQTGLSAFIERATSDDLRNAIGAAMKAHDARTADALLAALERQCAKYEASRASGGRYPGFAFIGKPSRAATKRLQDAAEAAHDRRWRRKRSAERRHELVAYRLHSNTSRRPRGRERRSAACRSTSTRRAAGAGRRSESPPGEPEPARRRLILLRSLRQRGASR